MGVLRHSPSILYNSCHFFNKLSQNIFSFKTRHKPMLGHYTKVNASSHLVKPSSSSTDVTAYTSSTTTTSLHYRDAILLLRLYTLGQSGLTRNMSSDKTIPVNGAADSGLQDVVCLVKCADFAAVKHRNQRRKDKDETPYINHPIGVARILAIEGGISDPIILQAALLHDTVEDTDTSFEEIEKEFGKAVREIVAEVTDDKSLPKMERKRLQIEHAPGKSREAKLVKLADKLYNLRDLEKCMPHSWTEMRVQEYFQWASQVVAGLRGTNQSLEDELDKLFKARSIIEEK